MMQTLPTSPPSGDLAIRTHALAKRYGRQHALRGIDLGVPAGAVFLLVGPNGSGKSTTLKVLLDLVRADAGDAMVIGLDSRADAPRVRANIGYVPEYGDWGYGWMRVGRLLEHHARYFPTWDAGYAKRLTDLFELQLERPLHALSKGQARRVHLTMALAHRPPLLLLDEPTDGLDPFMRDETLGALAEHLAETPTTVLLSTHHVEEVERLADNIAVLRSGELRAQMPVSAVQTKMRRYRAEVPDGWQGVPTLNGAVLRRAESGRDVLWTIWGDEADVAKQLAAAGATVRDAAPLSLSEATLALLDPRG